VKKKRLVITGTVLVLLALTATAALFTLGAFARSHQACGKVDRAALRNAGSPAYVAEYNRLGRCKW
jgi:hypothetical protein